MRQKVFVKCKGSYQVSAKGCGEKKIIRRYGLCRDCYIDWLLNTPDGKLALEKGRIRGVRKSEKEEEKKQRDAKKERRESITDYSKKLQDKINQIVRLIDFGMPCLARGTRAKQYHAGHVFSRGSNQTIRFNLHNIHRQSAQSNHFQNDDGLLREGLTNEYGISYMNFISELRRTKALKINHTEYKELYLKASKIALELKKKGNLYTKRERIKLRNEVNTKLGIYELELCNYKN